MLHQSASNVLSRGGDSNGTLDSGVLRKSWPLPFTLALISFWPQPKPVLGKPYVLPSVTHCLHSPLLCGTSPLPPPSSTAHFLSEESAASSAPAVCSRPSPPHISSPTFLALLLEPSSDYLSHTLFLSPSMPSLCPRPRPSGEIVPTTFLLFPRLL